LKIFKINNLLSAKYRILVTVLFIVLIIGLLFTHLGGYLVRDDRLQKSDIIVVLMGSIPDRILQAVDIYNAEYATQILMVNNKIPGYELLKEQDVKMPNDSDLAKLVGVQLGVKESDFIILPGEAASTQDEAVIVSEYLRNQPSIHSIIIVSSLYQSKRASAIFARSLEPLERDIRIVSCPSKYSGFNSNNWWKSREDIENVVMEYIKLVNFYLREQFLL